ncbi:hypothetical protein [Stakelama tenebrarum]|uniref:Uncharacterized protein n=1 Tax=Stakelama tenebrarum TaxID=2711215 RepID=A0A6G6Y942_9SPHN|nr:hypothetical protein [Sphingosinithalassobacter tenebrarum]QIG81430.1 hypothetical protein G5C33_17635 [Sphingosinithalassobacter tenebrarum]
MAAIGCFVPVFLMLGGVVLGALLGGAQGALWGGVAGVVLGSAVPAITFYSLSKARKHRGRR